METKLKKDILEVVKHFQVGDERLLGEVLIWHFGYKPEDIFGNFHYKIKSYLATLEEDGFLVIRDDLISLTQKGYQEFDSWYKKLWRFINSDIVKVLSLISITLSIIATIISISN